MDYAESLEELNTTIGDTGNITFTPEEKERALKKAWNDSFVVKTVWDSSLTFTQGTSTYTKPAALTTVKDIYIRPDNNNDDFVKIEKNLWEVVDGDIVFRNNAQGYIPTGYTLHLKGNYKLDHESDTLDTTALQEYVIALAGSNTIGLLKFKKANLFLKNDTSMGELISLGREMKQDVSEYRARLPREFESV